MKSPEEIAQLYYHRSTQHQPVKQRMRNLRDHYNGDIVVPLPEIDTNESSAVANLLAQGLDQTALRIGSVVPNLSIPHDPNSERSRNQARRQRRAILTWWQNSVLDLQLAKRARHLIGYAQAITQVRFDADKDTPVWVQRDPLSSYPSAVNGIDQMTPVDCLFGYQRQLSWMQRHYPAIAQRLVNASRHQHLHPNRDQTLEMIEYVDADEIVLVAVANPAGAYIPDGQNRSVVQQVERTENRIGRCPVVISNRISLDDPVGQFDGMLGMYQQQAKLMALEVIAVQKGIFPDTWLIGNAGEQPKIVSTADGLTGQVGVIRGGQLRDVQVQPGFMTNPTIDRLERAQRLDAGIPAEFGGESGSNIRTGRRGDAILRQTVDFTVQAAQRSIARALEHENDIAVDIAKEYGGNRPRTFYLSMGKDRGKVEYTPNKHLVTNATNVTYPQAGNDLNTLVIGGGQRVQLGTMSKRSFMEIDPMVENAEAEADAVIAEGLQDGLLAGLQQQAATGALPPSDLARIIELVRKDQADLADAVSQAQREAQERQAEMVSPTAPEAQPGIAQPGAGAEAASVPAEAGPAAGLRQLLGAL